MKSNQPALCLIEDDAIMGESLYDRFTIEGFDVDWHKDAARALDRWQQARYAAVISDIRLPDMSGEALFNRLVLDKPFLPPFIFITGYGSVDMAVRLLKMGANDYITKPFDLDQLVAKVRSLSGAANVNGVADPSTHTLGISPAIGAIEALLPRLAQHGSSVLLCGESGVGKEHVARRLHYLSFPDPDQRPFVAINCASLPETLLEAELFGYEKGAFTGAVRTKKGVFEQAHGGSLFLDEIGEMPLYMQAKLLRALQGHRIVRVGGETEIAVELRVICATNRNLKEMVERGQFREDLYYRINVVVVKIPPLCSRKDDILWFADLFLREHAQRYPGEKKSLSPGAEDALLRHAWPGNIRELRHTLERACILAANPVLTAADIFNELEASAELASESADELQDYLRTCERAHILRALEKNNWHIGHTAAGLGISRKNLWEKMRKLDIRESA